MRVKDEPATAHLVLGTQRLKAMIGLGVHRTRLRERAWEEASRSPFGLRHQFASLKILVPSQQSQNTTLNLFQAFFISSLPRP